MFRYNVLQSSKKYYSTRGVQSHLKFSKQGKKVHAYSTPRALNYLTDSIYQNKLKREDLYVIYVRSSLEEPIRSGELLRARETNGKPNIKSKAKDTYKRWMSSWNTRGIGLSWTKVEPN